MCVADELDGGGIGAPSRNAVASSEGVKSQEDSRR